MKAINRRLCKLEKARPRASGLDIRGMVRALSLDEARYCLWVMKWVNHSEIYKDYAASGSGIPTKDDVKRVNEMLPCLCLQAVNIQPRLYRLF